MTATVFWILALASFRLTRLVIEDTIADPIRTAILSRWPGSDVKYDEDDPVRGGTIRVGTDLYAAEPTSVGNKVAKLLSCYACAGFWVSLLVAGFYFFWPTPTFWVMVPFALSGAVWIIAVVQDWFEDH